MSDFEALSELAPYFSEPFSESEEEKIDELFSIFKRDFYEQPFSVDDIKVQVKIHPYTNHLKDGLPEFFCGYYEKFVHLVTREVKGRLTISPKQRSFVMDRANRIHWLKPILLHASDPLITTFKIEEVDGSIRNYFWYKAKKFMVVLEVILPNYILITGFCVDDKNIRYYERLYNRRLI
jgi:hypothetical protein